MLNKNRKCDTEFWSDVNKELPPNKSTSSISKIYERLVFNSIFNYSIRQNLLTKCQSRILPGYSCVSQLLSLTHEIHKSFDCKQPIDKAFDKVWYEGLLFKLPSYGVEGDLLKLIANYLYSRQQLVVLNSQTSCWKNICTGVPQGSVLGSLLSICRCCIVIFSCE